MSIYQRLFVWFFSINLVTLVVSIAIAHAIFERGADHPPDITSLEQQVRSQLEQGIIPDLKGLREPRRRAVLIRDGQQIGGSGRISRPIRPHLKELLTAPTELRLERGNWLVSRMINSPDGEWVLIVSEWPKRRAASMRWLVPSLQVLLSIVGIAVIGWIVSRYFTRPLEQLQATVRAVAAGSLDSRVDPELARRSDEYGLLARDFDRMAGQIEQLVSSRDQLLHDVSHELRAPLARLRFSLELARGANELDREEMLQRSDREVGRIDHLVGELLTLARLEKTHNLPERPLVNLSDLIAEVVEAERPLAETANITLNYSEGPTIQARLDADAMIRAIENVIRNAVRHSPSGSVINVSAESIRKQYSQDEILVTVQDQGPGVKPEHLARIFEPFFRAAADISALPDSDQTRDKEKKLATDGYGLGLAIVDRIMRAHEGTASANNCHPNGLEMRLTFPMFS